MLNHPYAVGAFDINNMEFLQGVLTGAKGSPVFVMITESAIKYAGFSTLLTLLRGAKRKGLFIHLDHGTLKSCKACIKADFDSVMIDGSKLPYKKNIAVTKKVVSLARKKNVKVEGELGILGSKNYTDPEQALDFVQKTKVDMLAVAIGNKHGFYKGKPKLRFDILEQMNIGVPLVLHGSSGLPDKDIKKAIRLGIRKINCDTELRYAFMSALRKNFALTDPRKSLGAGRDAVAKVVKQKIKLYGSYKKII
jgi:fructose-bisphosphate aldolase class II